MQISFWIDVFLFDQIILIWLPNRNSIECLTINATNKATVCGLMVLGISTHKVIIHVLIVLLLSSFLLIHYLTISPHYVYSTFWLM